MRTLVKTNHDVLPALLEPSSVLEYNAQIYSQVRSAGLLASVKAAGTHLLRPPLEHPIGKGKASLFERQRKKEGERDYSQRLHPVIVATLLENAVCKQPKRVACSESIHLPGPRFCQLLPALAPSVIRGPFALPSAQIRAFHFLRCGMSAPVGLLAECGKPAAIFREKVQIVFSQHQSLTCRFFSDAA